MRLLSETITSGPQQNVSGTSDNVGFFPYGWPAYSIIKPGWTCIQTGAINGTGYARGGSGGGNGVQYPNGSATNGMIGGFYGGGGSGTYTINGGGGGLGWKNNIEVVPGQSYTVVVGAGGATDGLTSQAPVVLEQLELFGGQAEHSRQQTQQMYKKE